MKLSELQHARAEYYAASEESERAWKEQSQSVDRYEYLLKKEEIDYDDYHRLCFEDVDRAAALSKVTQEKYERLQMVYNKIRREYEEQTITNN